MSFCPNCGNKIEEGKNRNFCGFCGARITASLNTPENDEEQYCSFCGAELVSGVPYCKMCGRGIEAATTEDVGEFPDRGNSEAEGMGNPALRQDSKMNDPDLPPDLKLPKEGKRSLKKIILIAILAVAVIAAAVVLIVVLGNRGSSGRTASNGEAGEPVGPSQDEDAAGKETAGESGGAAAVSMNSLTDIQATSTLVKEEHDYSAKNLVDNNTRTVWSEGADGDGIGEVVTFIFDSNQVFTGLAIRNGFQRKQDLFEKNGRVKTLEIVDKAGNKQSVEVADRNSQQVIDFKNPIVTDEISIVIGDVYSGSANSDTCITDIEFYGTAEDKSRLETEAVSQEKPTEDSAVRETKPIQTLSDLQTGDSIRFGQFESDNNTSNGKEALLWKVLSVENGKALLITEDVIAARAFGSGKAAWDKSDIRQWLNDTFIEQTFSEEEKDRILSSTVKTKKNPIYGTSSGKECTDKVFLLSGEEATEYFDSDSERKAKGTAFAKDNKLFVSKTGSCRWWLRDAGNSKGLASVINGDGVVDYFGASVKESRYGVRPVMWISSLE